MKQVNETKAAQSISAYVVLRNGVHVATVQFHFSDTGSVQCDVYAPYNLTHQGGAGGYGYDKRSAAISGAAIGGYTLKDDGFEWHRQLEAFGLEVLRAI